MIRDLQNNVQYLCTACTIANLIHDNSPGGSTLKIKTRITYLCSLIISDSVAVEIFAIGQPCAKIFRKVRCATFFETRCICTLCAN